VRKLTLTCELRKRLKVVTSGKVGDLVAIGGLWTTYFEDCYP